MDVDIYLDCIEPINFEELYEKYETYNVQQLSIVIKTFYFNRTKYEKTPLLQKRGFRTGEQDKQFHKFHKFMSEEWPWLNKHKEAKDLSTHQMKRNKKIWEREFKKFETTCHSNNELYYTDDVLTKINEIIKSKSTFNKKDYYNEEIMCECGCISSRSNIARHIKSKMHERKLAIAKENTIVN
jgi:hypothetical protein